MTSKPRTDSSGRVIEIGDIVASFPKSGGYEIARVTGIFDSGRVTGKVPGTRSIYAYEQGAPDVEYTGRRYKKNADGTYAGQIRRNSQGEPVKDWRGHVVEDYVMEDYTYMERDYTTVGKRRYWHCKQLADISLLVLRTADGQDVANLNEGLNQDWDAEVPA